ncbi:GntR family transcriptional regulator [Halobacillus litoralis]|uniref:GntR family transcriptional regulator n=1 Tax=Halobacillus litoralis TaxID=45668 RepID=UPI001CFE4927|nr:GntR family transcriptional regulator [Halobacillus litoralis]WLR46631.1 GntR family transcriptional regulator [Halobacillus litoralis]
MGTKKPVEKIIVEKIKQAILERELAPGTQLRESVIAKKLNTSRTPIRNAYRKLEEEGYVYIIPNRGAYVIQPDINDLLQAFELRVELECVAAKFGLQKVTETDVIYLKNLMRDEVEAYKTKDSAQYIEINKRFHLLLAEKSGNKFAIEFLHKVIDQVDIYLRIYNVIDYKSGEDNQSLRKHEEIIQAIEQRDLSVVQKLLTEHLETTLTTLKGTAEGYKSLDDML